MQSEDLHAKAEKSKPGALIPALSLISSSSSVEQREEIPAGQTSEVPISTKLVKHRVKLFQIPVQNSTIQDFIVFNKCTSPKKFTSMNE